MGEQNPDPTRIITPPEDLQIPPDPLLDPDQLPTRPEDLQIPTDPLLDSGTFIHPAQIPTRPVNEQIPPDPLLDSVTFIHVDDECTQNGDGDVVPAPAAAVEVQDSKSVALVETPVTAKKLSKRDPEEMAERPTWMPEDWSVEIRMRVSGATAGTYDRYYISPTGRKFRSKTEVLHFLETGSTKRKKSNTDGTPPASSEKLKEKKPKREKGNFRGVDFDFRNPPQNVSWTLTNASHDVWMAVGDEGLTQEHVKKTWDDAFSCIAELEGKK